MAFTGAGSLYFATNDLINSDRMQNLIFPGCIASFSLTFEDNEIQAKCLRDGIRVLAASSITETIAQINFELEVVDFNTLSFSLDEVPQISNNVVIPRLRQATAVADGGGASITDVDITATNEARLSAAGNNDGIMAYRDSSSANFTREFLLKTPGAPATANEFQVDTANNKLVFTADNVGAVISYAVPLEYDNIKSIGLESDFDRFGAFSFIGDIRVTESTEPIGIYIPKIQRSSSPEITINGDLSALAFDARPVVQTGFRREVFFFDFAGSTQN